ncbi:YdeI/OmpD-associated family protein [Oryzihumus sp.]
MVPGQQGARPLPDRTRADGAGGAGRRRTGPASRRLDRPGRGGGPTGATGPGGRPRRCARGAGPWDGFPRSTRRAILEWVGAARREQTRQTRIAETVAKARENLRANQWRQPGGR